MKFKRLLTALLGFTIVMSTFYRQSLTKLVSLAAEEKIKLGEILGDYNGDNSIDGSDASFLLKIYAEVGAEKYEISSEELAIGDIDKNGTIDGSDASFVLTHYALTGAGEHPTFESIFERIASEEKAKQFIGTWETIVSGEIIERFVFKEGGMFTLLVEWSQFLTVNGDNIYIGGTDVTSFTEFDGKKLNIGNNGSDVMLLTKKSGSADSYDGEYSIDGGVLKDTIEQKYPNQDLTIVIDGERTYIAMNDITTYSIEDNTIKMKNTPDKLFGDYDEIVSEFKFEGDKLTLTDQDGTVTNLTKVS
ncbi:MAG: hypothetical protein K6G20_05170 [Ruminococcus sp.]|nr:hypothetical protein [Ruminococcus sp.]